MRRIFSLCLAFLLLFSLLPSVRAAEDAATDAAQQLYEWGLFRGVTDGDAPDFALSRAANRYEAVVMLVRLLGQEDTALDGTWQTPFTDVAAWAQAYVGYAYANGLTVGVDETRFGGDEPTSAAQYLTLILRALGYESGTDFDWAQAWTFADAIGLTHGEYTADTAEFLRGDMAVIARAALDTAVKGGEATLYEVLFAEPDVPEEPEAPVDPAVEAARLEVAERSWAAMERNWDSYELPASCDPTLTREEAAALYGKDLATVAAAVKTVGDCIYYLAAAGFTGTAEDLQTQDPDRDFTWHYNYAPAAVLRRNTGNCGAVSGLVAALLDGDYDAVGLIGITFAMGGSGGHVVNYIDDGDRHCVFDIVNLISGGYQSAGLGFKSDRHSLGGAAKAWREHSAWDERVMYAYESTDGDIPVAWGWDTSVSFLPAAYREQIRILQEDKKAGYLCAWVTVSDETWQTIRTTRTTY